MRFEKPGIRAVQILVLLFSPGTAFVLAAMPNNIAISDFAARGVDNWKVKSFQGWTTYETVKLDGRVVLQADSRASASVLVREIEIDLKQTPFLNWSWKVEATLHGLDETRKDGDDYAARVYVVESNGFPFLSARAVNYVWSGNQAQGTSWSSAYTDRNAMVAVRGSDSEVGSWEQEKRNVREDFKALFGRDVTRVHAVAIMTDTDNSGLAANAYYGDLFFTAN